MQQSGSGAILSIRGLTKRYAGATALNNVSFTLQAGEVRAICGENGAGKSTFVKMLMGIVQPDGGIISVAGTAHEIRDALQAQSLGLGLVAQELSLAPDLSVLDNIWLGSTEVPFFHRRSSLRARAQQALATLGVGDWDLDRTVGALSIGQRQIVEIARLLARKARVLILDEPTATLSDIEIEKLMQVLRAIKARGHSIIYVSHRLGEVFELCDSVSVLRNGEHIVTKPVRELTRESLIELMLGRAFEEMYPERADASAAHHGGLRIKNLHVPGAVEDLSVTAPRGKILCFAGQLGSGATAVTRALAGLHDKATGDISIDGRTIRLGSARPILAGEVVFVTEDRAGEGIFPELPVRDNLVVSKLAICSRWGVISWRAVRKLADDLAAQVTVTCAHLGIKSGYLSGGNQQKLLFARAVGRATPAVLVMNEPTRGIDIGARAEIYRLMRRLCGEGYVLLMASSDIEEVVGMADIVVTLYRGRVVACYEGAAVRMPSILRDIANPDIPDGQVA
ncbi:sugar ABC transporter ATP-binding protein [Bradyrhizobium sp. dw_78]|uniref:sugar ABC transporter ATP-binding protein n=1 Tax=Bradyrhizobium sp. dw_78 TaxID=2719793 RepID=UPI001BD1FAB2|nr:sugar ABC transporter ATP-binding protein [Bradyrhizobium sp. dw_78]